MKYIIKNCDSYNFGCCLSTNGTKLYCQCKDITDCLLKRIVELCDSNTSKVLYEGETSKIKFVEGNPLAEKILKLLETEECENDGR